MATNTKKGKYIVRLSTRKHLEMKDLTLESMIAYVNEVTDEIKKEDKEKANSIANKFAAVVDSSGNEKRSRVILKPTRNAFIEMFPEIKEKLNQKEPKVKKTVVDKYIDKIKTY